MCNYKVCKESMQMEEIFNNFAVNYFAGEIEFDADGVAKLTCEKTAESMIDVECWPHQVAS